MSINRERRQARRQTRGLRRVEDILHAAGEIFMEYGYDRATANMIAQRADVSAGSLYQFFPNKEAIAQAFAAQAVERLQHLYEYTILAPEVVALPFPRFLDTFIDNIIDFNCANPGYFALLHASTLSPELNQILQEQRHGITAALDRVIQILAPGSTPEQREVQTLVAYRVFLALLPLILRADELRRTAIIGEAKALMLRYFAPQHEP
ncbi:TetR family transcriptional regulator [Reticulibacter mediterranei]|uniref:TetR family transcriptional regulator n=1 Tax=Reticulibacter mediterranei TaxID=2778369 RepID=A0A8J3IS13_9CHLR|nr:TetR/AcrR family transcriptional regulator [Reticulibacter mediterranei]GHO99333.1 TetR family transcriptional regulator [Reticulibacter mediterranei]